MTTNLSDQIKAVQEARALVESYWGDGMVPALSDAAQTILAIKLLLSGDIGEEWSAYLDRSNDNEVDYRTNAETFVDFLRERGLPINK